MSVDGVQGVQYSTETLPPPEITATPPVNEEVNPPPASNPDTAYYIDVIA